MAWAEALGGIPQVHPGLQGAEQARSRLPEPCRPRPSGPAPETAWPPSLLRAVGPSPRCRSLARPGNAATATAAAGSSSPSTGEGREAGTRPYRTLAGRSAPGGSSGRPRVCGRGGPGLRGGGGQGVIGAPAASRPELRRPLLVRAWADPGPSLGAVGAH